MNNKHLTFILLLAGIWGLTGLTAHAQSQGKKPLDHDAYDSWQSVTAPLISNNGQYVVFIVAPQDGDSVMYVRNLKTLAETRIERGYGAQISDDSRFVVFKIKPSQAEKKEARKKKKKADEQPDDTLGRLRLGTNDIVKIHDVKSFRMPEKDASVLAYQTSMPHDTIKEKHKSLVIYNFYTGFYDTLQYVTDYVISKNGAYISCIVKPSEKDSAALSGVLLFDTKARKQEWLLTGKSDIKLQSFDDEATKFVFFAATDTTKRDHKIYNLYYTTTAEPAQTRILVDTLSADMPDGWAVNTFRSATFSRDGSKLYFGISPIPEPKDTTIDMSEKARLDVWHWKDDFLQPVQLKQARTETNRSYLCVFATDNLKRFVKLGSQDLETVTTTDKGNAETALGSTTQGYRIESQWTGFSRNDVYTINIATGERTLVGKAMAALPSLSVKGRYLTWYDRQAAAWFLYSVETKTTRNITADIDAVFADSRGQRPEPPESFGTAGWSKDDKFFYIYDMYDIWQIDPTGIRPPEMITKGVGKEHKITFRYIRTDLENDFIDTDKPLLLSAFDNTTKEAGYYTLDMKKKASLPLKRIMAPKTFGLLRKAKNADTYIFTQSDFRHSPNLQATSNLWKTQTQLSNINPQMDDYFWGNPELVSWKSFDNVDLQGILYKPENFDPEKKYPMIVYYYERHSDELYRYFSPAPSRSTVNIPLFCSRGYLVFTPDINYIDGHPGRSAYNSIVSGVEALCRNTWVDKARIGIQGQSWGGYQTAYIVTQTDMFAAAGAGAPVANMTSAYGGIRWATGLNRQMQYERQQSRIGKTLWDGLDLYIENSPLFFADKVKTPLLIMHNDLDGAVPWYQGIELFTALRRLGKTVFMLQYNGEEHNLTERRNAKDLSVRLQQFFDHYLKGAPMPVWMLSGVPAKDKGRTWGLEMP
ncbi:MAG: prolyl oligopeptidase family serine peptidase [Tannerella sp.]|jgi:dipeptidyl aminopeptidase/acylaminoacyl peptidase|nr:prolyl oligopeptidase family serine peptidase [Tannerella sp.]